MCVHIYSLRELGSCSTYCFVTLLLQLMHFKHFSCNVNYQEHWYFTVVMVDQYHEVVECTQEPVVSLALSCQTNFLKLFESSYLQHSLED